MNRPNRRNALKLGRLLPGLLLGCLAPVAGAVEPEPKPVAPQILSLKTHDGLVVAATYYPSRLGKKAVPVVLLHAARGRRTDLNGLALTLQKAGHAVIAPDLRGHGDTPGEASSVRPVDIVSMYGKDGELEAIKSFLFAANDAGELNVERLCVVGVEMGANVALNWAALDWSWPVLNTGKQGQDVKALVLVSPEWTYKGSRISDALANPDVAAGLSTLIIVGKRNSKLYQESKRLYAALEKYHLLPANDGGDKQTLWLKSPDTSLQSTQLINERSLKIDEMILTFLDLRLVKPNWEWTVRGGKAR